MKRFLPPFVEKQKYSNYLIVADSSTQSGLLNLRFNYLYIPPNNPFRRGGFSFELGLNLARFFSKKFILSVSYETKLAFVGFTRQHFSQTFINDFNNSYISEYPNAKDSLRASVFHDGINGVNDCYVKGSFPGYLGIAFSPFPQKWGGFLLTLKKGGASYTFYGKYDAKSLDPHQDNTLAYMSTSNNIAVELSFKPYKFSAKRNFTPFIEEKFNILNFLIVSFYYERFSFNGAIFNGQDINTMVRLDFISKYSNQNYFGVKLCFGAY